MTKFCSAVHGTVSQQLEAAPAAPAAAAAAAAAAALAAAAAATALTATFAPCVREITSQRWRL